MRRTPALIAAMAITGLAVTACGGGAPKPAPPPSHHLSAAAACKDFQDWLSAAQGNVADVGKSGILLAGIAVAPSGQLYKDLSTLWQNVVTVSKAKGSLKQSEAGYVSVEAQNIQQDDCASVNPNS
jgi:hypothetical protein